MLGTEAGSRVMRRLAAPMIGGLVSATVLTLVVLPALYLLWHQSRLRGDSHPAASAAPTPQETP
jgi:Cu(I)/Ag(I) efflux system membrane protein CusA/SilA